MKLKQLVTLLLLAGLVITSLSYSFYTYSQSINTVKTHVETIESSKGPQLVTSCVFLGVIESKSTIICRSPCGDKQLRIDIGKTYLLRVKAFNQAEAVLDINGSRLLEILRGFAELKLSLSIQFTLLDEILRLLVGVPLGSPVPSIHEAVNVTIEADNVTAIHEQSPLDMVIDAVVDKDNRLVEFNATIMLSGRPLAVLKAELID